jgi:hypothetical protein
MIATDCPISWSHGQIKRHFSFILNLASLTLTNLNFRKELFYNGREVGNLDTDGMALPSTDLPLTEK